MRTPWQRYYIVRHDEGLTEFNLKSKDKGSMGNVTREQELVCLTHVVGALASVNNKLDPLTHLKHRSMLITVYAQT